MANLKDLHELGKQLRGEFEKVFVPEDVELPISFKESVKEIGDYKYDYKKYLVHIYSEQLNGYIPNQWFIIASFFVDYYIEVQKYKERIVELLKEAGLNKADDRKEILAKYTKLLGEISKKKSYEDAKNDAKNLVREEISKILSKINIEGEEKEKLIKFVSDYEWWYGGKTIDRGDFYVSPILSLAKVVNASHSYIAEICKSYAEKRSTADALRENYISEKQKEQQNDLSQGKRSLQQIFYGAPGTGKSKTIKDTTEKAEKEERVFRTTFHPDSDYSTFVGCYKPSMKSKDRIYSAEELAVKLKEIKNSGVTYPCHKFAAQYWRSIKDLSADAIKQILIACGFTESMNVEISKGVAIGQEYLNKEEDGKIIYTFTPQAFTNAYVKAWNTTEDVYLIIEEINRGNCAQIFGDLFQLLDRGDDGKSEYPIDADTDLGNFIAKELTDSSRTDFPDGVKDGKKLVLPKNLYIWATMNTSDQSLFPIDSAFKRRWDWKYLPIENAEKGWKIKVNGNEYDWYKFLEAINKEVFELTHSEDKQLGYFFAKAKDGIIDAETLVNKVYFYLWTDVFKDYDYESQKAFRKPNSNDPIAFKNFFEELKNDEIVNEGMAEQVLINLELEKRNKPDSLFE